MKRTTHRLLVGTILSALTITQSGFAAAPSGAGVQVAQAPGAPDDRDPRRPPGGPGGAPGGERAPGVPRAPQPGAVPGGPGSPDAERPRPERAPGTERPERPERAPGAERGPGAERAPRGEPQPDRNPPMPRPVPPVTTPEGQRGAPRPEPAPGNRPALPDGQPRPGSEAPELRRQPAPDAPRAAPPAPPAAAPAAPPAAKPPAPPPPAGVPPAAAPPAPTQRSAPVPPPAAAPAPVPPAPPSPGAAPPPPAGGAVGTPQIDRRTPPPTAPQAQPQPAPAPTPPGVAPPPPGGGAVGSPQIDRPATPPAPPAAPGAAPPPPPAPAPGAGGPQATPPGQPPLPGQVPPPDRQGRRGLSPGGAAAIGLGVGVLGGIMATQGAERLDDVRRRREERREGDVTIIREPGRTIIREDDGTAFIRRDETQRFRDLGYDQRVERRDGETRSVYERPDGTRVVTITDEEGRLIRRTRFDRDGREVVIIDNVRRGDGGPRFSEEIVELERPPLRIPRERYVVDAESANEEVLYETITAPPVAPLPRRYTLDEVRYSPDLRARMRSVDVNTINFETGSWEVSSDQARRLSVLADSVRRALQRSPNEVFLVEGHTDAVGSDVDNLSLSDRRAQSVAEILTRDFQIPAENLTTQGYGEQYLKVQTQDASRENRRVTLRRITPLLSGENRN